LGSWKKIGLVQKAQTGSQNSDKKSIYLAFKGFNWNVNLEKFFPHLGTGMPVFYFFHWENEPTTI
jgi:hypothetical protein